jgi:hypothetical protein
MLNVVIKEDYSSEAPAKYCLDHSNLCYNPFSAASNRLKRRKKIIFKVIVAFCSKLGIIFLVGKGYSKLGVANL